MNSGKARIKDINLIGYDILDRNVKYLKSDSIRFLIVQRTEEQTYKAVKKLFEFLPMYEIPVKIGYLTVDRITFENVDFSI